MKYGDMCRARLVTLHYISLLPWWHCLWPHGPKMTISNGRRCCKLISMQGVDVIWQLQCWAHCHVFSHCNLFILLRPLACLLCGTNHDTCDGHEEQGHDGQCDHGTLGQVSHGDQCYCHDHGTNLEGAGCLVDWQVISDKNMTLQRKVQSMVTFLILLLIMFLKSRLVILMVLLLAKTKAQHSNEWKYLDVSSIGNFCNDVLTFFKMWSWFSCNYANYARVVPS